MRPPEHRFFEDFALGSNSNPASPSWTLPESRPLLRIRSAALPSDDECGSGVPFSRPGGEWLAHGSDDHAATGRFSYPAGGAHRRWIRRIALAAPRSSGDELRVVCEVLDLRASASRSDIGLVKVRMTTLNQSGEGSRIGVCNLVVQRRSGV